MLLKNVEGHLIIFADQRFLAGGVGYKWITPCQSIYNRLNHRRQLLKDLKTTRKYNHSLSRCLKLRLV